jgi:hypothetical protein
VRAGEAQPLRFASHQRADRSCCFAAQSRLPRPM